MRYRSAAALGLLLMLLMVGTAIPVAAQDATPEGDAPTATEALPETEATPITEVDGTPVVEPTAAETDVLVPTVEETIIIDPTAEAPAEATPADATATVEVTATSADTIATATTAAGTDTGNTYIVQRGDNLTVLAIRFNTTVNALVVANGIVNPNLIFVGQTLTIPTGDTVPTAQPSATATPNPAGTRYTIVPGDTLFKIAVRFDTTVSALIAANNITNPNLIFYGRTITIPAPGAVPAVPTATTAPGTPQATPEADGTPVALDIENPGFAYGVTTFVLGEDVNEVASLVSELGVDWVKIDVRWRDLEPTEGQINFTDLDAAVDALSAQGVNVLLTVYTSPDWARSDVNPARRNPNAPAGTLTEDGPPDDFADYANFVEQLAGRYAGRVQAYEIWNEPNLGREWNSAAHPISAESYIGLLSAAYEAIKAADANAQVITGGLAPTGFNDGVNAIDDRLYLQQLYDNNVEAVSDAIAAHPGGWANPPDATCCEQPNGVETHYESPTFYFLDTLNDYREIAVRNEDNRPLWVTKFGWGTSEDTAAPNQDYIYITYTSLDEQAIYAPRGFQVGNELGYVGPMFLYNLNGCTAEPLRAENCFNSLIAPSGEPRPVFGAVAALTGSTTNGEGSTVEPVATEPAPVEDITENLDPTATFEGEPVSTEEAAEG